MSHCILNIEISIRLYDAFSLKDKRRIKRSLVDQLKGMYNISIAETQEQDTWNILHVSLAYVAITNIEAQSMAQKIREKCEEILDNKGAGEIFFWQVDCF